MHQKHFTSENSELTNAYFAFINHLGKVHQFRRIALDFDSQSVQRYEEYLRDLLSSFKTGGPNRDAVIDPTMFDDPEKFALLIKQQTELAFSNAATAVEAAALIYVHAAFDSLISSLVALCVKHEPNFFIKRSAQNTALSMSLKEIFTSGEDTIRDIALKKLLTYACNASLVTKCEAVWTICESSVKSNRIGDARYDKDSIKRIDHVRNEIVHQVKYTYDPKELDRDLDYLMGASIFFTFSLCKRFGFKLIPGITQDMINNVSASSID